jgi:hypothetical protein
VARYQISRHLDPNCKNAHNPALRQRPARRFNDTPPLHTLLSNAPEFVTLHAKLIIVEQPAGNSKGLTNELMFGSLTMENDAVLNDQVWLSIGDPNPTTFAFYKKVFNEVFSRLTGTGADIPDTDPSSN